MNLIQRHHAFFPTKDGGQAGTILLEAPPHRRTLSICARENDLGPYNNSRQVIDLPRMLFAISYGIDSEGKYINLGKAGRGLYAGVIKKPLEDLDVKVHLSEQDSDFNVCTDHYYDAAVFDSLEELVLFNLNFWYGAFHVMNGYVKSMSLTDFLINRTIYHKTNNDYLRGLELQEEEFILPKSYPSDPPVCLKSDLDKIIPVLRFFTHPWVPETRIQYKNNVRRF